MKNKTNLFLVGSIVLILLAIALVAILDKTAPAGSSNDVRARAETQNSLHLLATVTAVNEAKGTIDVTNAQFADTNRAGQPQNLGDWTVTVPAGFDIASVSPGMTITIGIDPTTFNVTSHALTAVTLTVGK